ncbi:hypothetical protein FUAX_31630 [Fulvitalea axinellae]|uniref:Bacterial surface antigen (D15) domain-containing protein n=2 Tax=Fulvitalea axinellae TaxID=1182444 RepID=A0AAU9CF10_9BACT|nr:hypothetical protein FUAX_31630 [Fulvitalea axinellae]
MALFIGLFFFSKIAKAQENTPADTVTQANKLSKFISNAMDIFTGEKGRLTYGLFPVMDYEEYKGFEIGIMPVFQIRPADTTGMGEFFRPTTILPEISYSTKGHISVELDFISFTKNKWNIQSRLSYYRLEDVFYGPELPSGEDNISPMTTDRVYFIGEVSKNIGQKYFVGFKYDLTYAHNYDVLGEALTPDTPGYGENMLVGVGPLIKIDNRNNTVYPSKGGLHSISYTYFSDVYGSDFTYGLFNADFRQYFSINKDKSVLAIQTATNISTGGDIPFFKLPGIAGSRMLRGFAEPTKYVGRNTFLSQAEFRQHIWWRFGSTAFAGFGNTSEDLDKTLFRGMEYVYGFGGRFQILPNDKVNFRVDMGYGPSGKSTMFFSVTEAF